MSLGDLMGRHRRERDDLIARQHRELADLVERQRQELRQFNEVRAQQATARADAHIATQRAAGVIPYR